MSFIALAGDYSDNDMTKFIGTQLITLTWRFGAICVLILTSRRIQRISADAQCDKVSSPRSLHKVLSVGCFVLTKLLIIEMACAALFHFEVAAIEPLLVTTAAAYFIDCALSAVVVAMGLATMRTIALEHGAVVRAYDMSRVLSEEDVKDDEYTPSPFQVVCRHNILSLWCILSSKVYLLMDVLSSFVVHSSLLSEFVSCLLKIYLLINISCVFLWFGHADMWYYGWCTSMQARCANWSSRRRSSSEDLQEQLLTS